MAEVIDLTLMVRETLRGRLHFFLEQNGVWLDMGDSDEGFAKLAAEWDKDPKDVSVSNIEGLARDCMRNYSEDTTPEDVKKLGSDLYNYLLPKRLSERLISIKEDAHDQTPILRICCTAPLDRIPWEVIYYEHGFLGLHFQVVRNPIVDGREEIPCSGRTSCKVKQIYTLLGEDVLDVELAKSWEATFAFNGSGPAALSVIEERHPTVPRWQKAVRDGHIIHITCLGAQDKSVFNGHSRVSYFWTFKPGGGANYEIWRHTLEELRSDLKKEQREDKPLVFANVCTPPGADWKVPGFSRMLFPLGVAGYIGSLGLVYKKVAVEFARRFYRNLLVENDGARPKPIAEALWETKREFWDDWESGTEWDASWLFYCLYGQPDMCFELAE